MTYPVVHVSNGLYNAIADSTHGVVLGYDGSNKAVCDDIIRQLGYSKSDILPPMASGIIDAVFTRYAAPDAGAQHVYIFVISPPFDKFPYLNQMEGDWGLYITSDVYVSREFIYSVYVSIITSCTMAGDDNIIRGAYFGLQGV